MEFTPILPSDFSRLKKYFEEQKYRLSAYSPSGIIVWGNNIYKAEYVLDGDTLIISNRCITRPGESYLLLPISQRRNYSPSDLRDLARKAELDTYWYVPQEYLEEHESEIRLLFQVTEQPELEEYLYKTKDLALLRGNRYASKRNWVNRFEKDFAGRILIEPIVSDAISECLLFLEDWCRAFPCSPELNESLYCEKQATINALKALETLNLNGILIRINGYVEAFAISSGLTKDIGVLSFEKARSDIKGLYQFLDRECARRLFPNYQFINKENDMGLPGLAQSKQSYHPIEKIKSYRLTLKSNY
jgi:hypothetical protein